MPKTVSVAPGDRFANWTIVRELPLTRDEWGKKQRSVIARCDCGNEKTLCLYSLRSRKSQTCSECCDSAGRKRKDTSDMLGKRFGKWVVVKTNGVILGSDGSKLSAVLAKCDCGSKKLIKPSALLAGETKCCRACSRPTRTHGKSKTSEYRTWEAMVRRCYIPHSSQYRDYGGRGVTVCDRWNPYSGGSFENFYTDLGPRPTPDHHLDKDFVEGNLVYGPGTAKWVHRFENAKRKRNAVWVEWKGEKIRLTDLAEMKQIPVKTLWTRIKGQGMSVEVAVMMG